MGQQRELAEWVAKAAYYDFPEEVVSHAKGLLLKTVAGMLMGSREHIGPILTRYVAGMGGPPEAGVVAGGFRTSVENAAYVNASIAHASELEDNQVPEQLSTFWVLPAFFPLAEKLQSSGRQMIEAAIISFEVYSRYGRALPAVEMIRRRLGVPPTWYGPVAVAAGAAKLLEMTADQIDTALSVASSHSSGLYGSRKLAEFADDDTHFLESGITCRNGLQSAILAKQGVTSRPFVLEQAISTIGNVCFAGKCNPDMLTEGLGKPPYSILQCCVKKYSACTLTHPAVDALGLLMKEHGFAYEDVESVEVESGEQVQSSVGSDYFPTTLHSARFSIPFLLAEVLLRGKVDEKTYAGREKLLDPKYNEAQRKVSIRRMAEVPFEYTGCTVTVVKKDGQRLAKHLEDRIGSPIYPLTLEQIRDVCRPYLGVMLDKTQSGRVEELMLNLEKQPDILELMNILTFSRVGRRA